MPGGILRMMIFQVWRWTVKNSILIVATLMFTVICGRELLAKDNCAKARELCRNNCMKVTGDDRDQCLLKCYIDSNTCVLK